MNLTIIIIIAAIFLIGTPIYMKFVLPKMMAKMNANQAEAEQEWTEKSEELMDEFLTNSDKFGLLKQALQGQKLYGVYSGKMSEKVGLWERLKERQKELITLTREVDMNIYYLVAAEDGLHYMGFDGERCVLNEVFDYGEIVEQKLTKESYIFDYKEDKIEFNVLETLSYFPRFNVHEVQTSGSGQGGIRQVNMFVREWLAWEITNNSEYKTRVEMKPTLSGDFIQKKEFFIDQMIRKELSDGFLAKLGISVAEA